VTGTPPPVVFDLFGTLLDIRGLRDVDVLAQVPDPDAFVAVWREKQLAYAFTSAIMDRYADFDELTARAARFAADRFGIPFDESHIARLVASWREMPAFPDALDALRAVHALGGGCGVLTNGAPATAAAALATAGMTAYVDAVLSVDTVRIYKPSARVYALVGERYGRPANDCILVTANGWDGTGAAEFGMRVAWCNRAGVPAETFSIAPTWTIGSLSDLAALVSRT
jgi:2-haloacid dehalogenase